MIGSGLVDNGEFAL